MSEYGLLRWRGSGSASNLCSNDHVCTWHTALSFSFFFKLTWGWWLRKYKLQNSASVLHSNVRKEELVYRMLTAVCCSFDTCVKSPSATAKCFDNKESSWSKDSKMPFHFLDKKKFIFRKITQCWDMHFQGSHRVRLLLLGSGSVWSSALPAGSALICLAAGTVCVCGSCICISLTSASNYSVKISAVLSRKRCPRVSKV